jgi:hypothetical protein
MLGLEVSYRAESRIGRALGPPISTTPVRYQRIHPMMIRLRHTLLSAALALCCLSAHAQQTDGLQQRMSADEFKAAVLDKLSPQELQNLDAWLNGHAKVTTQVVTKVVTETGTPVFYPSSQKRTRIDTRITGHFDGWSKDHEFTMANGQVWKTIDPDPKACQPSENPAVQIKPSLIGTWMMYVPSCYENAHVKRVR